MRGLIVNSEHKLMLAEDIPMPQINEYEALVRVECCAICNGTDKEIIRGTLAEASRYPLVLGHESVGIIEKVGERVRHLNIGDRVLRPYQKDSKKYASSWGGFSEYAVVTDALSMLEDGFPVSDHYGLTQQVVDPRINAVDASVMITLKETFAAMARMNVKAGQRILILGSGPVGLCMAQVAHLYAAACIGVVGRNTLTLGIAHGTPAKVFNICQPEDMNQLHRDWRGRTDHFVDTVGKADTMVLGQSLLSVDGMLNVYGLGTSKQITIPMVGMRNFGLRFLQWPTIASEQAAHKPVQEGVLTKKLSPRSLVSHIIPIECFEEGFTAIREKRAAKVILTMHGKGE